MKMTNTEANITANVAEQGAPVAPEKASPKKGASQKKGAPRRQKAAKAGKHKARPKKEAKVGKKAAEAAKAKEARTPRPESKGAKILAMIGQAKGATLSEIMKATDWQAPASEGFSRPPLRSTSLKSNPQKPNQMSAATGSRSKTLHCSAAAREGGGFFNVPAILLAPPQPSLRVTIARAKTLTFEGRLITTHERTSNPCS
jgi:hypothetical protein